jgi:hypothetical protein
MMPLNVGTREVGASTHDGVFGSVFPSSRKEKPCPGRYGVISCSANLSFAVKSIVGVYRCLILPAKHSTLIAGWFLFHTLPEKHEMPKVSG